MKKRSIMGKVLRLAAILLLGLTAVFHLLGGIGTSCVALFAGRWDSMAALVQYQWLYIVFVLVTVALSLFAIQATFWLARGRRGSFRYAFLILLVSLMVSGAHMAASEILRGSSAPTSMRVYLNALTLVVFLLLGLPPIARFVRFEQPADPGGSAAAGAALILMGISALTVQLWAGPTHTWADGVNYADVWHGQLTVTGWALVGIGAVAICWRWLKSVFHALQENSAVFHRLRSR